MDRRGFIQGMFGGLTAGGILLNTDTVAANEVRLWTPDTPLLVAPPVTVAAGPVGSILFDHQGRPVAVIKAVKYHRMVTEASGWTDPAIRMIPGPWYVDIIATSIGPTMMMVEGVDNA